MQVIIIEITIINHVDSKVVKIWRQVEQWIITKIIITIIVKMMEIIVKKVKRIKIKKKIIIVTVYIKVGKNKRKLWAWLLNLMVNLNKE